MTATIRRLQWVALFGLAIAGFGCSGGDESSSVDQQSDAILLGEAEPGDDIAVPGQFEPPEQNRVNESHIRQIAGTSEDDVEEDTIEGFEVFDEGEDEEGDIPLEPIAPPREGTPEFYIHKITTLRLEKPAPKLTPEELQKWDLKRSEEIIKLAEQAIALTHRDPQKERIFNIAVNKLLETRLQLAVNGDKASIDALYEHADALHRRDPESPAAAEGAYTLTQLAFSNSTTAVMTGIAQKDPRWLQEFAKQAEDYAIKFPKESQRSVPLLFAAAERCELNGLNEEAIRAYTVIAKRFPKHPAAEIAVTVVRRLGMTGRRIKLFGETLNGQKVSLENFAGKPIVIYFWATTAEPSVKQLAEVSAAAEKYGDSIGVIGVCLDQDQKAVEAFLQKQPQSWPNIFNPDETKRAWNNPVVKFYGVRRIPATWIIDAGGRVVSTSLKAGELDAGLGKLLNTRTATRPRTPAR